LVAGGVVVAVCGLDLFVQKYPDMKLMKINRTLPRSVNTLARLRALCS